MRAVALIAALLVLPAEAWAGNMDTHMSATYVLARQAGLSREDASLVARADWSMDLNEMTEAIPHNPIKDYSAESAPAGHHDERAAEYHSLGKNPEEVRARLEVMRGAIATQARVSHEAEMRAVGQYLHALQDVSFHQKDGQPYDADKGHIWGWSRADKVRLHFDAELRALDVTAGVLRAVAEKKPVPEPASAKELYRRDAKTGFELSREDVLRISAADSGIHATGVMRVATTIFSAYPPPNKLGMIGDVDVEKMNRELEHVWQDLGHEDMLDPLPAIDDKSPLKIDYDQHPDLLSLPPKTIIKAEPGGIALSRAVANALPIDLDLDSIRIEDGAVVLSGSRREGSSRFDAPLFLTAMRLACEREDPYFSLDPADGKAWSEDTNAALREAMTALGPALRARIETASPETIAAGLGASSVYVDGPQILADSVRSADPDLWKKIRERHPHMASTLVFHPEWLRETRLGESLFEADLLLKEIASGMSFHEPGMAAPVRSVAGFVSADGDRVARLAMDTMEGKKAPPPATAARLWFELPRPPSPPSIFNIPTFSPDLFVPSGSLFQREQRPQGIADVVRDRLRGDGYLGEHVSASPAIVRIASAGGTLDLSEVWPQVFVKAHDPTTNQDVDGSEESLDALARRVNADVPGYAEASPVIGRLVAVLRAYVAATRIVSKHASLCSDLASIPLSDQELLRDPLPPSVEGDLVVAVAHLALYKSAEEKEEGLAVAASFSGGVSLSAKSSIEHAIHEQATEVTDAVAQEASTWKSHDAAWGVEGRGFVALRIDLPALAVSARDDDEFVPVTKDDVDAMVNGTALAVRVVAPARSSHFLLHILSTRWTSAIAALMLAGAVWGGVVALIVRGTR